MDTNGHVDEPIFVLNNPINIRSTIEAIVASKNQENPFYICDIDDIIQKYEVWKTAMPRVKPHYAIKCNDHPIVLKTIAALGLGFDCASKMEIEKVLLLGVDPKRIIYAHTTKPPHHIRYAAKVNVDLMTFDNEMELYKIKNIFPTARTVIRIKYDAKAAVCLGLKFGCDHKTEALNLLKLARDLDMNVIGVSFHVGWGCRDPSAFHGAIVASRYVFDIASTLGFNFELLDIGGGYPGDIGSSIKEYGEVINAALQEYFPDQLVRVISEPGTYFVDSAFSLACNVISAKKLRIKDVTSPQYMYYLNDGAFGSFSIVISANVIKYPQPVKKYEDSKRYLSIVWGPTCDSTDRVAEDALLPEMQLGDWVYFQNMGAYTLTICTPFNSFELPIVYSFINRINWLLLHDKKPFLKEDFVNESDIADLNGIDLEVVKENKSIIPLYKNGNN